MKNIYKIALAVGLSIMVTACKKYEPLGFEVEKPVSVVTQEQIDSYKELKSYLNFAGNPNFKLGVALSLSDYIGKGVMYRLANSNFNEIVLGYEMKHGAVVKADGSLDLDNVKKLLETAKSSNMEVYGHTLCWHANQNATYLKSIIAPLIIPGNGPSWDLVTGADFETANNSNYEVNSNLVASFTAAGEGAKGTGRAIKLSNAAVRANDWEAQFFLKFPPVKLGEKYLLTMDVRSDVNASYSTQAHTTAGNYKFWDFFGTINSTPTWTTYTKEITVSADIENCGAIAFNMGKTATNFYIDNITLTKYNALGGVTTVEKTADEKKTILTTALDKWISGMLGVSKSYVKAWDVVNEPMSDYPDSYQLKTGVGKTLAADEFYWQDYLGKDYAVTAFKLARQYGNASDIHFINDYGLEGSLDKCKGLIEYVKYIESKGAKVDGIGTQMHMGTDVDKNKIVEMFKLLAATGKLIKVSELDMGLGGTKTANATAEQYQVQADMYKYVIDKYFELIPAAQRYGITLWSPLDSPANSSWRPGEPIGLWTEGYIRKPAYTGVADALKNK